MSEFRVGRSASSEGNPEPAALAVDRVVITRDSILQWKIEGRVFYCQQGNAGTKLDFAETSYDEDQPQFALIVPEGTLCIPLAMNVTLEDVGGTENHLIWSLTTNDIGAGTSTALAPVNYRRDNKFSPACKANSLYTANATAASGLIEVKRWYRPFASAGVTDGTDLHHYPWSINDPEMPVLVGPATLQFHCYATSDGPHGFGEYTWIELPAASVGL